MIKAQEHLSYKEGIVELGRFSLGKKELISGKGGEENGARLFSAVSSKRTGAMGTN